VLIVIENSSVHLEENQAFVICLCGDMYEINYVANVLMHQIFVLKETSRSILKKKNQLYEDYYVDYR
jgi:hypothetical protein